MVLVDGTMAGDTPGRECPREDGIWRPQAGETRPAGVSVGGSNAGLSRAGETLSSPDVVGRSPFWWCLLGGRPHVGAANPAGSDGPVAAGGPIGPCETLSPLFHDALGPLEHSVMDHAGPVGRCAAVGPVGPDETLLGLDPLEHSDLDHADPVGRHVAGGPVCPDETLLGLDPLEHSGLDHADPAGRPCCLLLSALWACLGRCPHLTVTLLARLARLARMLQGALLAQMRSFKFWIR